MMASSFKSFITEKEVEEVKKKRQEEWERIRKPDQPLGKTLHVLNSVCVWHHITRLSCDQLTYSSAKR